MENDDFMSGCAAKRLLSMINARRELMRSKTRKR